MICFRNYDVAIILAVFFFAGIASAIDAAPKDDAYHYMSNGVDDQLYNEWWYFDVADSDNDSQLQIIFLLSDPENITSARKIQVHVLARREGLPDATGSHQSRGYGGDRNSPMFDIDKSGFAMEEEPNLRIWGEVADQATGEPIRWDLLYQPAARPWFAIPVQAHIGHLKGGWLKWLVYMPSADVTGTLKVGNSTERVQGTGYHEHAWGRFALSDPQITRASVSVPEEGFSLALAGIQGDQSVAFLGIEKDGKSIGFSGKQIKLNYSNYSFDNVTASVFPSSYNIQADNGDYRLDLAVGVQKSAALTLGYHEPVPSALIFLQVAFLQGRLKSGSGEGYSFAEQGFSAFFAPRLHPISGSIGSIKPANFAPGNITIIAKNERTGQEKTAKIASGGFYSLDADYQDYLANNTAPWVANGDLVRLVLSLGPGDKNSTIETVLSVNLSEEKQEANFNLSGEAMH
jgi:hypothetical protein